MALQDLGTLLHRLALAADRARRRVGDDDPDARRCASSRRSSTPEDLQLHYQIAVQARSEIGLAPDEYAGFTMTLLRMLAFAPGRRGAAARHRRGGGRRDAPAAAPCAAPRSAAPQRATQRRNRGDRAAAGRELAAGRDRRAARPDGHGAHAGASTASSWRAMSERIELRMPQAHAASAREAVPGPAEGRAGGAFRRRRCSSRSASAKRSGSSPAAVAERERERQQAQAIAAIEQDPFVRELVENFDARVNESSHQTATVTGERP